jgi:hypothetical protein
MLIQDDVDVPVYYVYSPQSFLLMLERFLTDFFA